MRNQSLWVLARAHDSLQLACLTARMVNQPYLHDMQSDSNCRKVSISPSVPLLQHTFNRVLVYSILEIEHGYNLMLLTSEAIRSQSLFHQCAVHRLDGHWLRLHEAQDIVSLI